MDFRDFTDPIVEIAGVRDGHAALIEHVEQVAPDLAGPSRLPGWSIGHVLTHIEHNAAGYRSVLAGGPQYESYEARDRAIDAEAGRSLAEIVDAMRATNDALVAAFDAETNHGRTVQMLVRPSQPGLMTLGRRREIEVHHLDLGLGRDPTDIERGYVERDTAMLSAWWEAKNRRPLPEAVAVADVVDRWMWLVGRAEVADLDRAGLF